MAIYIRAGDRQGKVRSGEMGGVTWNQPSGLSFNFLGTALPYPMFLTRRSESWIMEERLEVAARMSSSTSDNSHFNLEQTTAHHQPLPLQPGANNSSPPAPTTSTWSKQQLTTSHSHFNLEQTTAHHQPLPLQPGANNSSPPATPTSTWSKQQLTTSHSHFNLEQRTACHQPLPLPLFMCPRLTELVWVCL